MTFDEIDDEVCEIMMEHGPDGHVDGHELLTEMVMRRIAQAVDEEREACATVCDALGDSGPDNGCCPTYWNEATERAAADIRKRSNVQFSGGMTDDGKSAAGSPSAATEG